MAGSRRAQDIDQWRPEEQSTRDRDRAREHPRERINDPRPLSPAPRAARDSSRRRTTDADIRPSIKHARGYSHERSLSRDRTRRRSRAESRDEPHRASRREPSSDRVPHSHRHHHHYHHHHHRDTTPSSKHHFSRSPSSKTSHKRVKRPRSRSPIRSRSRTRRADSTHRRVERAHTPPKRLDRERAPIRPTPDSYIPPSSSRRRSPSVDSHYRPVLHRSRKRSISPDRGSRLDELPRRTSPGRRNRRSSTPPRQSRERSHVPSSTRDRERSRSRAPRAARSRSRKQSLGPTRRVSSSNPRRDWISPRRSRSPRVPQLRPYSSSLSPKPRHRSDREEATSDSRARANEPISQRGSPVPASGHKSDPLKDKDDDRMRGAYHYQGRGGSGFAQSPPYPSQNQYSTQGQSPYHGGRGGWSGHQHANQG
jgi:CTD kinase subunit alpha